MNIDEFKKMAEELAKRPIHGKRLFAYNGTKKELLQDLSNKNVSNIIKEFDLLTLIISENELKSESNIQKIIKKSLRKKLEEFYYELKRQQILIITSTELLARYKIDLTPFYEYYISDRTMVILLIPSIRLPQRLKNYLLVTWVPTLQPGFDHDYYHCYST